VGIEPILIRKNAPIAFQKIPTVKKVKLIALRKSILKIFSNKIVTNKPVPEDTEPLRIPIKKIGITNFNLKLKLILSSEEINPKFGFKEEYRAKTIEKRPNTKYKYCSERNLTIDVPKITPGIPKKIICHETYMSFFRFL
tara:strand:+ start:556 stop:975 length:420 start_codon:yes stop_codon:yes gene_type:complete